MSDIQLIATRIRTACQRLLPSAKTRVIDELLREMITKSEVCETPAELDELYLLQDLLIQFWPTGQVELSKIWVEGDVDPR